MQNYPNCQALKLLHHSPEFLPLVVFLSSPGPAALRTQAAVRQNGGPAVVSSVGSAVLTAMGGCTVYITRLLETSRKTPTPPTYGRRTHAW